MPAHRAARIKPGEGHSTFPSVMSALQAPHGLPVVGHGNYFALAGPSRHGGRS
jgi:hypothetical protein